ncbi:putative ATP-dependent RNA helicase [Pseudomonas aeruginosa]|nr:putative ATP-dependent RNA helicase [Pseudomonas aeruginosa]
MSSVERYLKQNFERRNIKELKAAYQGPKKLKASGKAAGSKKKKQDRKGAAAKPAAKRKPPRGRRPAVGGGQRRRHGAAQAQEADGGVIARYRPLRRADNRLRLSAAPALDGG